MTLRAIAFRNGMIAGAVLLGAAGAVMAADDELNNLFVSPCGEPFMGPVSKAYPVVQWFERVDANKDGKIDKAEFTADAEAFFKRLDINADGMLTSDEIYVYEHKIVPEILNRGSASLKSGIIRVSMQDLSTVGSIANSMPNVSVDPGGSRTTETQEKDAADQDKLRAALAQGAAFYTFFSDPEPVMSADRNFDFKISHKEFMDQSDRHFARLDPKGKGFLTLADLPKTPAESLTHARRTASR